MSVQAISWVWQHADAKGSDLLVLLAIANYAKDDGSGAWPSIAALARDTRLSSRNVQYIVHKLAERGQLNVHRGAGPHGAHLYDVVMGGAKSAPVEDAKIADAKIAEGVQPSVLGGAIAIAPNPSVDPSVSTSVTPLSLRHASTGSSKKRKADPIWDALVEGIGKPPQMPTERKAWNAAAKEFRDAGIEPAAIVAQCRLYRAAWPKLTLTPHGLLSTWTTLPTTSPTTFKKPNGGLPSWDQGEQRKAAS